MREMTGGSLLSTQLETSRDARLSHHERERFAGRVEIGQWQDGQAQGSRQPGASLPAGCANVRVEGDTNGLGVRVRFRRKSF